MSWTELHDMVPSDREILTTLLVQQLEKENNKQ